MTGIAALPFTLAQALTERNPASRLTWAVAGLALAVLAIVVAVEVVDWIRESLRRWRGRSQDEGPAGTGAQQEPFPSSFQLREPDTELRRRFFSRIAPRRRSWSEGRVNEPAAHREPGSAQRSR